jgi:predicted nucleic acid-binding protein
MSGTEKHSTRIECFLDTNILIYAAAGKKREPGKHAVARRIVTEGNFCISAQVLAEFYVNVTKKAHVRMPPAQIDEWFELLGRYPVAAVDIALVERGVFFARQFQIDYFDAALVAAAERLQAPVLYTEDLNHDQLYGSVRVVNPFRGNA